VLRLANDEKGHSVVHSEAHVAIQMSTMSSSQDPVLYLHPRQFQQLEQLERVTASAVTLPTVVA
jgi:hypothetical protein